MTGETVLILDFGGQYKELIARHVREHGVYSEIRSCKMPAEEIRAMAPKGIIFTGGPDSVYRDDSPTCDKAVLELGIPVLGICYGMQLICHLCGGTVEAGTKREYGVFPITLDTSPALFRLHRADGRAYEPHRSRHGAARGLPRCRSHRSHTRSGVCERRAPALRRAVPSGSDQHRAGQSHSQKLPL